MRYFSYLIAFLLFLGCTDKKGFTHKEKMRVAIKRNYNDVFKFFLLPPTGDEELPVSGDTAYLLTNIPYLLTTGVFPSESILNQILSEGVSDSGMSGGIRWDGYKLKSGQFDLLYEKVKSLPNNAKLEYIEPDEWVKTNNDWNVWVMYIKHNIPWEEHKRLNDKVIEIENKMESAEKNNDENAINELHLSYVIEAEKLSNFIMKHMDK